MRTAAIVMVALLVVKAGSAAQNPAGAAKPAPSSNLVTLTGCVSGPGASNKNYTLAGPEDVYTLRGLDVKDYAGKQVEITGTPPSAKKIKVVGGLYPSPNVAAQGGAIDPVKAAIASQSGPTAAQAKPPIEFRVQSVRALSGNCPAQ